MEAPPLTIDEPGFLEEIDSLVESGLLGDTTEEAQAELAEMYADAAHEASDGPGEPVHPAFNKPTIDKFVNMGNGLYLPVRQRIVWMRGEPERHPDWSVETELMTFEAGTYQGTHMVPLGGRMQEVANVTGGFAIVHAQVRLPDGRVIATGHATERSELFHDFVEKAETAAIGRALAIAGYGTEAAIDLDEGAGNLADAPVRLPFAKGVRGGDDDPNVTGPIEIKIEASAVPGVRQGGRQSKATRPQLDAIRTRVRELMMAPSRLQEIVRATLPPDPEDVDSFYTDDVDDGADGANEVLGYLSNLSFEDCGKVVLVLQGMTNA